MEKNKNIVVLMMGGKGTRFQQDVPKQFSLINGIPLYLYILQKLLYLDFIDSIIIVTNPNYCEQTLNWNKLAYDEKTARKIYKVIPGGKGRSRDIASALEVVSEFASPDDVILFHDVTHPYVDIEGTKKVIEAVNEYGGATLGGKQYDTMYMVEDGMLKSVIDRENVVSGASPEGFQFKRIYDIYKNASIEELEKMTSAGALALANNIKMKVIPSNVMNLKITYPTDMIIFKSLVNNYFFKEEDK